jgi:voltage-gated potassium channel
VKTPEQPTCRLVVWGVFMDYALTFLRYLFWGFKLASPVFLLLLVIIVSCGQIVGRRESWSRLDALYWSLITALTVGYGDFVPVKKISRCLSVLIAFCGIIFTGIVIAVAIKATTDALERHGDLVQIEQKIKADRSKCAQ